VREWVLRKLDTRLLLSHHGNRDSLNHRDNPRCQQVEEFLVNHIGHIVDPMPDICNNMHVVRPENEMKER